MLPNTVIELSVRLSVSYVPWCDPRFSMTGIASPILSDAAFTCTQLRTQQLTPQLELALLERVQALELVPDAITQPRIY